MKISEKDLDRACEVLDTQFAGYSHDKVLCLLSILVVEEIKGLRRQMDDLQSSEDEDAQFVRDTQEIRNKIMQRPENQ